MYVQKLRFISAVLKIKSITLTVDLRTPRIRLFLGGMWSFFMPKNIISKNGEAEAVSQKVVCPKCGSDNITFSREKIKQGGGSFYKTISLCHSCGYSWNQEDENIKKIIMWGIGLVCFFPIPVMILLKRNEKFKPELKKSLVVMSWLIYFVLIGWIFSTTYQTLAVVNCRFERGIQYKIVNKIQKGTYIRCKSMENGWCKIKKDGKICYINGKFIKKISFLVNTAENEK